MPIVDENSEGRPPFVATEDNNNTVMKLAPRITINERNNVKPSLPKKAEVKPSCGKVMLSCFCNCKGMIMTDNLENGQILGKDYY